MSHKAIIAKIDEVFEIPGAEKIHVARVLGEDVIVGKDWGVGYIGVFFPVDLQLSEQYCFENNLYRDNSKNKDQKKKGFFENNRRVRAQPFLKVKSCGYFTSIDSLESFATQHPLAMNWTVGETFDELNGVKICQKYISEQARKQMSGPKKQKKAKEVPFFEKHIDSEQFKHYAERIPFGALLSFHAKVHGTSFRVGYTQVVRELSGFKKFVNKFIPIYPTEEFEYVVGTRNVILDNPEKEGFHGSEAFRFEVLDILRPYLEKGMVIYGEIAGYVNGKPIMPTHDVKGLKDKAFTSKYGDKITYSYGCKEHEYRFHIYRIARQTVDGSMIDMDQQQLEKWCANRNLNCTYEVFPQMIYNGDIEELKKLVNELTERPSLLTEDYIDPSHISEGIIIRVDSGKDTPDFYKNKSYAFRVLEGLCEAVDEETIN